MKGKKRRIACEHRARFPTAASFAGLGDGIELTHVIVVCVKGIHLFVRVGHDRRHGRQAANFHLLAVPQLDGDGLAFGRLAAEFAQLIPGEN